ncbi:hypothetical protein [Polymorphospora lycopeni]|uniref:hypothetical protein n=1 Tax=Polymorphospora lycopeni TaxID=3140240 RepID=UPI0035D3E956
MPAVRVRRRRPSGVPGRRVRRRHSNQPVPAARTGTSRYHQDSAQAAALDEAAAPGSGATDTAADSRSAAGWPDSVTVRRSTPPGSSSGSGSRVDESTGSPNSPSTRTAWVGAVRVLPVLRTV